MRLITRWIAAGFFLACAIAGQQLLQAHLAVVRRLPATPLQRPLARLPLRMGEWVGTDQEIAERTRYGDEHLHRIYRHEQTGQQLTVWVAYSGVGADRFHHPEVCMAVAGQQEDRSVRQSLPIPGPGGPVQQYAFHGSAGVQWIFYWHYTLPLKLDDGLDPVQRAYQRLQTSHSSITVEVFAPSRSSTDAESARQFVVRLDGAVRECAGADAVRGSERLRVAVDG